MTSMTGWNSTSRSAPAAIAMTASWSAWRKCYQSARIMKQCLATKCPRARSPRRPQGGAAQARRDEAIDGSADPSLQTLHRRLPRARRRSLCRDRKPQGRIRRLSGSDGSNKPYRCKIRPTAFSHLQAMDFMMSKGHMLPTPLRSSARSTSCSGSATGEQVGHRRANDRALQRAGCGCLCRIDDR
jgi:hypothetical protein